MQRPTRHFREAYLAQPDRTGIMLIARPDSSLAGLNINNVAQNRVTIESITMTSKYAIRNKLMIMLI